LSPLDDVSAASAEIADFLRQHHGATSFLFHCHASLSRSRSVVAAYCTVRALPYQSTVFHEPLYTAVIDALRQSGREPR
jgi:predicted protein tyrosine phosphatase